MSKSLLAFALIGSLLVTACGPNVGGASPSAGRITRLNVNVGSQVKAGDVLAELERDSAENTVRQARAALAAAEAKLASVQAGGLISQGFTNRGAAGRLFISEATVKTHLLHIYAKLEVNDRAAAVATAFERGLLRPNRQ
jgi:multidrug efflux pump subunit AcrA (membrane-fusion protein)